MIIIAGTGDTIDDKDPTPARVRLSYFVSLIGVDGSVWDLNRGTRTAPDGVTALPGGVTLLGGVEGLFSAPVITHRWRRRPKRDGGVWMGASTDVDTLTLPVRTAGDTWDEWQAVEVAWDKALDPDGEATLVVTTPDAVTKTRGVRWVTDGRPVDTSDPLLRYRRSYPGLQVVSGWPFWRGEDVVQEFKQDESRDFFVNDGSANLFWITASAGFQAAKVTNPGDLESYPSYDISGPTATFAAGIDQSIVSSSQPMTLDESIHVDVDTLSIVDQDGARAWEQMDVKRFAPIPRGEDIPLSIDVTGYTPDTSVTIRFPVWYRRPFA